MGVTLLGILGVLVVYFALKRFAPSAPGLLLTILWTILFIIVAALSRAGDGDGTRVTGLFIYVIGSIVLFIVAGKRASFWVKNKEEARETLADSIEVRKENLQKESEPSVIVPEVKQKTQVKTVKHQDHYFTLICRLVDDAEVKELISRGYNHWCSGNINKAIEALQSAATKTEDIKLLAALHIEIARLEFINREFSLVSENLMRARELVSEIGHRQVEQEIERMLSELPLQNTHGDS